jgi:monofunctional biosynthetic peptidoglycan transglycosylase
MMRSLWRWLVLVVCAWVGLQLFFALRIASMLWLDPQSTAFERSQAWQRLQATGNLRWRQQWRDYDQMSVHLKRAAIASEDDRFSGHDGLDWVALEKAWARNAKAEDRAARRSAQNAAANAINVRPPKVVGGSTITQQLAKNLFLSGERTLLRKGQELVLTLMLEQLLDKQRILEIYLNSVEWGEGVFGAEAAAQHYFRKSAAQLTPYEAARLVVMLPRPRYFEKLPNSEYLSARAQVIVGRMADARLPGASP